MSEGWPSHGLLLCLYFVFFLKKREREREEEVKREEQTWDVRQRGQLPNPPPSVQHGHSQTGGSQRSVRTKHAKWASQRSLNMKWLQIRFVHKPWRKKRGSKSKQKFTPQRNEIQNDGVNFLSVFFNVAFWKLAFFFSFGELTLGPTWN